MKKMTFILVAVFVLAFAVTAFAGEKAKADPNVPTAFDTAQPVGAKATCPVMGGGEFTVTENSLRSEHNGKHVVFCCPGCKPKFEANPEQYLK